MKTLHTKGNWFYKKDFDGFVKVYEKNEVGGFERVCELTTGMTKKGFEKTEANAKLIVAAHQLLDLLIQISENLELQLSLRGCQTESAPLKSDADSYGGIELLTKAKALIKKAIDE